VLKFNLKAIYLRHFWGAEGGKEIADPCQDPHPEPEFNPLWIVLDTSTLTLSSQVDCFKQSS
jgi:hypothetical protein